MSTPESKPSVIPIQPVGDGALFVAEKKVYARSVKGWYANWRWVLVWLTQIVFYGLPWLRWNERQAVLFDLGTDRFYLFGLVLYPQDFIYLAALLVLSALLLFFFTAIAGRLWCGYACPQTVYTEIFMWFELKIEGDRMARMKLDQAPWSAEKVLRKGGKQLVWCAFALVTGFTFTGYFTPIHELLGDSLSLGASAGEWFSIAFYAMATYGNAGFLREQMCKYICPYARFQSALIDKDSMIITYDAGRGEPRGARSKKAVAAGSGKGDCVDCTLCVQVCPTGIDIRNGLQNECIGCAACIDACDGVMDKIGAPRGLIRYSTENGVAQHLSLREMLRRVIRPRVLIYATLLTVLCSAFIASLAGRSDLLVDVIRDRNVMARIVDEGQIENIYRLQIANRTERAMKVHVEALGLPGVVLAENPGLSLDPAALGTLTVQVRVPPELAAEQAGQTRKVTLAVVEDTPVAGTTPARAESVTTFMFPR